MRIIVYELEFDEANEDEMWRNHTITRREVTQVLDEEPRFFPNKKVHGAPVIMVGPTTGGRFLTVPIAPTAVPGRWRPATAFPFSPSDMARYGS